MRDKHLNMPAKNTATSEEICSVTGISYLHVCGIAAGKQIIIRSVSDKVVMTLSQNSSSQHFLFIEAAPSEQKTYYQVTVVHFRV